MKSAMKWLSMLLALCMIWTVLPGTALGENVTEGMGTDWSSGTYDVNEDVTINGRINTTNATVNLYLHGHTLIVNGGIYVPGGSTLRISTGPARWRPMRRAWTARRASAATRTARSDKFTFICRPPLRPGAAMAARALAAATAALLCLPR